MAINGFNSVSSTVTNYGSTVQNAAQPVVTAVKSLPTETLALAGKSVFTGSSIAAQIASNRRSELPNAEGHIGAGMMKTGRNAAIVGGLISLSQNTYDFIQGKVSGSKAGGNITSDVVGGLGSGIVAAGSASVVSGFISSGFGAGVAGLVVGTVAFVGADMLYRKSGAYQAVSNSVTSFIDSIINRIKPTGGW